MIVAAPRRLPDAMAGLFRMRFDLRDSEADFFANSEGASAILATAFDTMDAAFFSQLPASVRFIASVGVGVDHIDLDAARTRGVMVSNTPDVTTPCLADATIGLIIASRRRFREGLDIAQTGEGRGMLTPESWGRRVSGATLGVIGMGNVGQAVAKRARAFDMTILYATPRPSAALDEAFGAKPASLEELLRQSDIVTLHCPYKDETHHLVSRERLGLMKADATLINIARGPVVDELALIEALASRRLFSAGLDVFETEPGAIRKALRDLPNVFCLPHIASATLESRRDMALRAFANLAAFEETGAPSDRVL
jgi:lactate dehydrogenase-like 2-hydroxyacid dehydrogenase